MTCMFTKPNLESGGNGGGGVSGFAGVVVPGGAGRAGGLAPCPAGGGVYVAGGGVWVAGGVV